MMTSQLPLGAPFPGFAGLRGVDGNVHDAEEYAASRVIVVVFSCNHCPYVQAYEQRMVAFQNAYAPRGVQLVAINANDTRNYPEDDYEQMVRRARQEGLNFPYLRDEDQKVAEAFHASHTPEFFVFASPPDSDRKVLVYHGKMDDNYQKPQAVEHHYLKDAVDAVLEGRPVKVGETHSIGCTIKWR